MLNKQFRYYGSNNSNNFPNNTFITADSLHNGIALAYTYPIIKINIQSLPGTQFYINGNDKPFIIDESGIFNLEALINIIQFNEKSLSNIQNNNGYLIINYQSLND